MTPPPSEPPSPAERDAPSVLLRPVEERDAAAAAVGDWLWANFAPVDAEPAVAQSAAEAASSPSQRSVASRATSTRRHRHAVRAVSAAILVAAGAGAVIWHLASSSPPERSRVDAASQRSASTVPPGSAGFQGRAWLADLGAAAQVAAGDDEAGVAPADEPVTEPANPGTPTPTAPVTSTSQPDPKVAKDESAGVSGGATTATSEPTATRTTGPRLSAQQRDAARAAIATALERVAAARSAVPDGSAQAAALDQQAAELQQLAATVSGYPSTTN